MRDDNGKLTFLSVKRIVRNKTTREFLSADGKWVADCRLAQDFRSMELIIWEVQRLMLKDVELVLLMGEQPSDYDVTLGLFPKFL